MQRSLLKLEEDFVQDVLPYGAGAAVLAAASGLASYREAERHSDATEQLLNTVCWTHCASPDQGGVSQLSNFWSHWKMQRKIPWVKNARTSGRLQLGYVGAADFRQGTGILRDFRAGIGTIGNVRGECLELRSGMDMCPEKRWNWISKDSWRGGCGTGLLQSLARRGSGKATTSLRTGGPCQAQRIRGGLAAFEAEECLLQSGCGARGPESTFEAPGSRPSGRAAFRKRCRNGRQAVSEAILVRCE